MDKIRQVGTIFGHPIYVDDSVQDGDVRVEPAPAGDALPDLAGEALAVLYEACERALQGYHNILDLDLMPHKGYDEDTKKIIAELDAAMQRARKLQEADGE